MDATKKKTLFDRFLDALERGGNKLPDPAFIFIGICAIIIIVSVIGSKLGWGAMHPAKKEMVYVVNLLSKANLSKILDLSILNFTGFPPLGMVLVVMLGIGVAERTGYFKTLLFYVVQVASVKVILPVLILVGILGHSAGDAGPIVLPPLAAIVFMQLGYHPISGMIMIYAATLGAFAANLIVGMSDVLAFSFTEPASKMIDVGVTLQLNAAMNYYFTIVSTFVLTAVIYFVVKRFSIPRFGIWKPEDSLALGLNSDENEKPTELEIKAMRWANWSILLVVLAFAAGLIPEGGAFRNAETGSIMTKSPFMNAIGTVIAVVFFVPGFVYGWKAKKFSNTKELASFMNASMSSMGGYIVIAFFAAQMLAYFNWSNLGVIMAIKGAELLQGQSGTALIIGMIIVVALINLFIVSASAKWAILAPIFVPMFMLLGYHPAFTQMIYRIGDSITNPISPMNAYLPMLLSFAQKYDKKAGIGSMLAGLLPYTIFIGIAWTILVLTWFYLGLPVGPGGPLMLK